MKKSNIKRDKYKSARSGDSKIYEVMCSKCNNYVLTYQKDGTGMLKRLYFDRIISPQKYNINAPLEKIPPLICSKCKRHLATPYIYPKEKRKAYRLYPNATYKKLKKPSIH